ncbi:MAG: hypothetical protein JNL74_02900 [Fibrobacteres bacterium]|nr:hypothetical protein [Fibrobacterota bacterium]
MKTKILITLLLTTAVLFAQDSVQTKNVEKVRVAVLNIIPGDGVKAIEAIDISRMLRKALTAYPIYHAISGDEMAKRAKTAGTQVPAECLTEFCALDMGQTLAASKVITGEFEIDGNYKALKLKSFDLEARDFNQKTSIAADCPAESLQLLADAAIAKLFGHPEPENGLTVKPYRGKEIKRHIEWGVVGIVAVAGALSYAASQGILSPTGEKGTLETVTGSAALANQRGAFGDLMMNARPHGMGGAFIALSDDGNALAYNPAGLTRLNSRIASAGYLQFNSGDESVPYFYAAYAGPVTGTISQGIALQASPASYGSSETKVIIGAAKLFDDPDGKRRPFSIGINAKFLMFSAAKATGSVYSFQENAVEGTGFGFAFDLGAQIQLSDRITAGILLKDIYSRISYTNTTLGSSYTEGIPQALIIGGHYRLMNTVNLVLDGHKSLFADVEDHVRLGIEKRLMEVLALRIGMSQNFSMESNRRYHAGFGIDAPLSKGKQRLSADYSYEYFHTDGEAYGDLSGSQRFAVSARF